MSAPVSVQDLAVVFSLAAGLAVLARWWRQPLLLAYVFTGVIVGAATSFFSINAEAIHTFADLGIMFLLFLIGLEINIDALKLVGWSSLMLGLAQIIVTFSAGLLVCLLLGVSLSSASYIALALTFSSTILVVKVITERHEIASLHGKLSLALLLVQDLVAILLLVILAGLGQQSGNITSDIVIISLKAFGLFALAIWLGRSALPWLFRKMSHSAELLFLISIAWVLIVATGVQGLGLSVEIGGFLAGLSLANSAEHLQIAQRIRPLRDFFILLFFVYLGTSIGLSSSWPPFLMTVALVLFVMLVKPLIVYVLVQGLGYHRRTNFLTSLTTSQVSEFSFVLLAVALSVQAVGAEAVSLVTLVGVTSMALSSYVMWHGPGLYRWCRPWLVRLERKRRLTRRAKHQKPRPVYVLIGAHRTGQRIISHLPKADVLVIDFDPEVVARLRRQGYECLYGDLADDELFETINWSRTSFIVSTSPDADDNTLLLQWIRRRAGRRPLTILRAENRLEANQLYAQGADYVLLPHLAAGQYLGEIISSRLTKAKLEKNRRRDAQWLKAGLA